MANRRIHPRQRVNSLAYVDLGPANGGLVRDVSEGGLALTAAANLVRDVLLPMRFQLSKFDDWIEAYGRVVWVGQSGKEAGLRFEQLPEAELQKIKNWISITQGVNERTTREDETADTVSDPKQAEPAHEQVAAPALAKDSDRVERQQAPETGVLPPSGEPAAEFTMPISGVEPPKDERDASNMPEQPEGTSRKGERRSHARQTVGSLEYVDLGPANGGMLLNLSEGGLALTAAVKLVGGERPRRIRFHLPNLQNPIEARGRIVWLSESKKKAGIRFEELSADVLQNINKWISAEQSGNKEREQDTAPTEKTFGTTGPLKPTEPLEEPVVAPALAKDSDGVERQQAPETGVPQPSAEPVPEFTMPISDVEPLKDERDASNMTRQMEGTSRKCERRAQARQPVGSLEYVDLGPANGGMLLNLGEGGLALTAAVELIWGELPRIRFRLRNHPIEARGRIVWLSESKKEAGVRFDELSADVPQKIRNWISTQQCGHKQSREGAAQDGRTFEYLTKPSVGPAPALLAARKGQDSAHWRSMERRAVAGVRQRSRARSAAVLALVALVSFGTGMVIERRFRGSGSSERIQMKPKKVTTNRDGGGTDGESLEALAARLGQQLDRVQKKLNEDTYQAQQAQIPKAGKAGEFRTSEEAQQGPARDGLLGAAPAQKARSGAKISSETSIPSASSVLPTLIPESAVAKRTSPASERTADEQAAIAKNKERKDGSLLYGRTRPDAVSAPPIVANNTSPAASARVSVADQTKALRPEHAVVQPEIAGAARRDGTSTVSQPAAVVSTDNKINLGPSSTSPAKAASPERSAAQPEIAGAARRDGTSIAPQPASVVSANDQKNLVPLSTNAPTNSALPPGSESASGSIVITMPPFPSIRIPPQLKSQPPRLGMSVQIGQLASRIEPAYPPEAIRKRMEGTVKLHATIGRDGAVQSVVATGPPLLADAAMSAVRQWRYRPTLLGGQAIEADEDIIVVFRLSAPPLTSK
jgi:periplasmic protein TonB